MYEALPDRFKSKRPARFVGWDDKARLLWKHADQIDFNKAFDNLVVNELEDRFIGTLGKGAAKLSAKTGRPVGLQTGPAL